MSGRPSSSPSSPPSGSAGLAAFVQSLRATWRPVLVRFALAFVLLALAWLALAPAYAHMLVMLGRPLIPVLEAVPGTRYGVEGASVWATRLIPDPVTRRPVGFKFELWRGYANYDLILLAALIFATPGWPLGRRGRLIGLGLGLLTLAQIGFFLVTIEFSQVRSLTTQTGPVVLPGFPR